MSKVKAAQITLDFFDYNGEFNDISEIVGMFENAEYGFVTVRRVVRKDLTPAEAADTHPLNRSDAAGYAASEQHFKEGKVIWQAGEAIRT